MTRRRMFLCPDGLSGTTRIVDGVYGAFGQVASTSDTPPYCYGTSQYVTITPGQRKVRLAISWNSHGTFTQTGPMSATYSDTLTTDFDLIVRDQSAGNTVITTGTNESSANEIADWFALAGHTYKVEIKAARWTCGQTSELTGWASVTYPY